MISQEKLELIATRVPPGDRWELVGGDGEIYKSLTLALNAWFQKTREKAAFKLAPLDGKLYVIRTEQVEETIQTFDIYGEPQS